MQQLQHVIDTYDRSSEAYWENYHQELAGKPLDRMLLQRFAREQAAHGLMGDLGCGPGQTTQFLRREGVQEILGIDLSPGMIETARKVSQQTLSFAVGNMLNLGYPEGHFGSLLAFYAVVHFPYPDLEQALREAFRVLRTGGQFLFSFHIGTAADTQSPTTFLGQDVTIDFYFFEVERVLDMAEQIGWQVGEVIERYPYRDKEYPSRRAYITLVKPLGALPLGD